MYCHACATQLTEGSRFCQACGAPVNNNAGPDPAIQRRGDTGYDRSVNVVTQLGAREGFCPICNRGRSLSDSFVCWRCKMIFLCPEHQDKDSRACERCAREIALEQKTTDLQAVHEALDTRVAALQTERDVLHADLSDARTRLAAAERELAETSLRVAEHRRARVQTQAEQAALAAERTALQGELAALQSEAANLRRRLETAQADHDTLRQAHAAQEQRLADLAAQLAALADEKAALEHRHNAMLPRLQAAEDKVRRVSRWKISPGGVPVIASWEDLKGVEPLPARLIWERDGQEMVLVPGGPFVMGTPEEEARRLARQFKWDERWSLAETPQRTEALPPFYVDRTPVTQAAYARFLAANPGHHVPFVDADWARPYNWDAAKRTPPAGLADHPVVLVSWEDGAAYAAWAGKALPGEEQWEKAARGPDGRIYPWGNTWDSARCNNAEQWAGRPLPDTVARNEWWKAYQATIRVHTTAVGSYPAGASPCGALDMAGNVWEWCLAWYDRYANSRAEHADFGQKYRVVRGGAWRLDRNGVRCAGRFGVDPRGRFSVVGFRCASTPF